MATEFEHAQLFGGAIVVDLPTGLTDVSTIRQVPDSQEVYLSSTGFTSIVFDVTERVSSVSSDEEALKYHFSDIVDPNDTVKALSTDSITFTKLPQPTPSLSLLATTIPPPPTPTRQLRANTASLTAIILILIRLPAQSTDLVITINVPYVVGKNCTAEDVERLKNIERLREEREGGVLLEEGMMIRERVRETFEISDWGLFGTE